MCIRRHKVEKLYKTIKWDGIVDMDEGTYVNNK